MIKAAGFVVTLRMRIFGRYETMLDAKLGPSAINNNLNSNFRTGPIAKQTVQNQDWG